MTTHYLNSRLTVTSGQRLCHSLSVRIQPDMPDVTLGPQKSPLLIWLGCCSQKVDGHSCSDPTSYSLFTLILPNLHQNRPQIAYSDFKDMLCIEKTSMVCPALPFRPGGFDGPLHRSFIQQDQKFSTQNKNNKRTLRTLRTKELCVTNTLWAPTVDIKVSTHNPRRLRQRNLLILAGWQQRSWHRLLKSQLHLGRSREPCDNPGSTHGDTLLLPKEKSFGKGNHPEALEICDSV